MLVAMVLIGVTTSGAGGPEVRGQPELTRIGACASVEITERVTAMLTFAGRVDWDSYPDDPDFIVLADTEGNRFCIVDLGHQHAQSVPVG